MTIELEEIFEDEDDESVSKWIIKKTDEKGTKIKVINDYINGVIEECEWVDDDEEFIFVRYNDWDDNYLTAIINTNCVKQRDFIIEIREVIPKYGLIIVEMSGLGTNEMDSDYEIYDDESKIGVIYYQGGFLIEPKFDQIIFDEEASIFVASYYDGKEFKFDVEGILIN